jgi:non-homologous end joining protein Ku
MRLIEQKKKGEKITAPKQQRPQRVVNILDALRKSLDENKTAAKPKAAGKSGKRRRAA